MSIPDAVNALEILYNDKRARERYGRVGREKVEKIYNWDVVNKQWADLIEEMLR